MMGRLEVNMSFPIKLIFVFILDDDLCSMMIYDDLCSKNLFCFMSTSKLVKRAETPLRIVLTKQRNLGENNESLVLSYTSSNPSITWSVVRDASS